MVSTLIKKKYFLLILVAFIGTANATVPTTQSSFFSKSISALKTSIYSEYTPSNNNGMAAINPATQALGFQAFIKESVGTVNGDMEGPLAMGGDLNIIGSMTIGGITSGDFTVSGDAHPTGLLVGGKIVYLSGSGINLANAGLLKLGELTGSNIHDTLNGSPVSTRVSAGDYNTNPHIQVPSHQTESSIAQGNLLNFESLFADFSSYSMAISQLPANLTVTNIADWGEINLTPNQLNVLNISGTDLASYTAIEFKQKPSASQPVVINVDAAGTFNWTGPTFSAINDAEGPYILFNFYNSDFLVIDGSNTLSGTILAPMADFTKNTSGNIAGQVITKVYTHVAGELHYYPLDFEIDLTLEDTEICGNNLDDDNDGLVDNYDADCCAKLSIIPQANYTLHYTDSEKTGFGEATNAFDGDTETLWHSDYDATVDALPHEIQIDLGNTYKIGALRYLPTRTVTDGRIEDYEVYVSDNGTVWGNPVAAGTLTYADLGDKTINFPPTEGRYVRLVALSEINGNNYTTALEINILECKGQEICDDNIDNDGDGLVDCEDPDCSAAVSLSATSATNCGDEITVSANQCITYATVISDTKGNVTNGITTIDAPDGVAAFFNRVSDGTYTRMVWDFGEIIPDGEEVCFRVRCATPMTNADVTVWLLNSGTPQTGSYNIVTTQSFTGTTWQDLCFTMPRPSRYVKITDNGGAPFYIDGVGRKCRDVSNLSFKWNTGETTSSIIVNGAGTATYSVAVTNPDSCVSTTNISVVGLANCPEICGNGKDDDGDGFVDGGDTDCTTDCEESLLFIARDYGEILQVNLNTGATSVAGTSPYTNGNLNAMAANPDAQIVYYGRGKNVYYWNPLTNVHGTLVNLNGQVGNNESLTSGGGAYFDNTLYLGFEDDNDADYPTIYKLPLSEDGLSTTGNATNLNVPIPTNTSWGDMIVTSENNATIIYAGLGYNGDRNESLYFKYEIESDTYTTIRTDMPSALQIGVDVDGNLWGGGLETGSIRKMDKNTGVFSGSSVHIGGDMWDLTGPINCPQQVEICGNGKDDDGDGRVDSDDDDCDCPTIATTDPMSTNICAGETVTFTIMTDASTIPFHEVEFYRFTSQQSNPYTSSDTKVLVGALSNDTGMGSADAIDFPAINYLPTTYYVYALFDDVPSDLADCAPYLEYIVNVEACSELEINCTEGRTIETYYTGLNYAVPKTMNFTDLDNIDSIIVQIVYENNSPGNSIQIQDAGGNVYTLFRKIFSDIDLYETTIPPTSSIYYNNESNEDEAQSIVAYVYRRNQKAGAFARYSHAVSGHANTRTLNFPLPNRTDTEDFIIKLPLSELTYDNRLLTFTVSAGTYTNSFTRRWGPSGVAFTNGCCIELIEIEVPDVPASVDNISIEIYSPDNARGQSYIVAGTVFLEIDCFDDEICDDNMDNDGDGDIDEQDIDCSGYCSNNGTFLPYGMLTLGNVDDLGWYAEQYDLTFKVTGNAFLYWTSGANFSIKGTLSAYRNNNFVGKYTLSYTATGAAYATYNGDNVLGSTGGSGKLISQATNLTEYDEILMGVQLNNNGLGLIVREYSPDDIRIEGDWSFDNWTTTNTINLKVNPTDCQEPREICGNGEDDDGDGLADCDDADCDNPNNGGTIAGNETNCGLYTPTEITESNAPNEGGDGIPEYEWEKSIDNGNNWTIIPDAGQATYRPDLISQTTRYRRKVRNGACNPWQTSNPVTKTVTTPPFEAEIINAPIGINGFLCAEESYAFQAATVDDAIYSWEFGEYATPTNATGRGPHNVVFNTPTDDTPISTQVILTVLGTVPSLCVDTDTIPVNIRPLSEVITIQSGDPSLCGATDGWIELTAAGQTGACIEVSLDGGLTYQPEGQFTFTGLLAGSYEVVTRYCDNNCPNIAEIVNLSDPATIILVNDDFTNVCPGFNYSSNVKVNDDIRGATVLSLASNGNYGSVALEENGDFVYTPHTPTCDADQFAYTVCDPGMNCCATAVVTIDFNDLEAPTLVNVPKDLTVNCDDEIPLPPLVSAFDNCPAISIDKEEKSTQGEEGCALYDYTITYTWIAQDFCGNAAIDSQLIRVKDVTAPDIYRIYTLPNGKKMVAGVMENVTQRWKIVQLPIEFPTTPLIFTQLTTTNESAPVIARLRNVSKNQFELKIQEETANSNERLGESVAWFALEPGTQLGDYQLETAIENVGEVEKNINFQQSFAETPAFFTTMQTTFDKETAYPRNNNLTAAGVKVKIEEEESVDTDITHTAEEMAYLAIDTAILTNDKGAILGETNKKTITTNWTTINLTNTYTNPVVVANSLSTNEDSPAIVQVSNVTANSFDIRVKAWDYLSGTHADEEISYIVLEGSIPLNGDRFCEYGTDSLVLGVDIVAVDNCDQNVNIVYEEEQTYSGAQQIFSRTWFAEDECGNKTTYAQDVICEGVYLRLSAILQGAQIFNEDGLMRDDLRKKGLIPLTEPYSNYHNYQHIGEGGGEKMKEDMMYETGKDACVDWVFVELCDGNDISRVVSTKSALIQKDGDVMSADGDTLLRFENIPPGNYFVALSHRNHLKTVSLYPYTFTPNTVPIVDFKNEFTPVIGIEPNVNLSGNRALWSGDLNGDNRVIYQGPQNDIFEMFLQIILDPKNDQYLTNYINTGYTNNDFNMDGTVIFQGPNNDKSTLLFNTTLKHPKNPENFSNFVIATHADAQIADWNDPSGTIPGFDFDKDGLLDNLDPDDDNDGVADGNDIDPKNPNSDTDGDGITDIVETGADGIYHPSIDSDPLNPCDPNVSSQCIGIDSDKDGYFRNYPIDHPLYDSYDENACLPNTQHEGCICVDADNDGFIELCHKKDNGEMLTKNIPISVLPTHLGHGDTCGPCN